MKLEGKNILVGVTGGIAAYKAVELVRLLTKRKAAVNVVMTENAEKFVTRLTFQTISGNPVIPDTFDLAYGAEIKHISIPGDTDLAVIAPATADFIGKAAGGIADDLLTTMMLAITKPVLIAPSMNVHMYENGIVQDNIKKLKRYGFYFIEPDSGWLACGYEGKGRLAEPEDIVEEIESILSKKDIKGKKLIVTAGPTREYMDPVRFISNPSSGKMGYAIARAARLRGAEVTLISGRVAVKPPYGVKFIETESAKQMLEHVSKLFNESDGIIMSAAVSDYTPVTVEQHKIKKMHDSLEIKLYRTVDILESIAKDKGKKVIIGFAAETDDLEKYARQKMKSKRMDMIVANDVAAKGSGFGVDTNRATLIYKDDSAEELPLMSKAELADVILDRMIGMF
ncbi:MAG: bifunctional phosphopantothenoylcysteine decarboxylase/phosphopantothenate--cysteine ligase CoaBC [Deltaproteobacteria bacterium]|nr:bifunctional phosphopantothenoylcysteine decarboxylase/phosphopantothenate--cysteine ligase CoaBC [Deltaproteobacteria bacterium]